MTAVIDASVAIKWFVLENLRVEALNFYREEDYIAAPGLLILEIANTVRKKFTRREITEAQVGIIISGIQSSGIEILPSFDVREHTAEISFSLKHSAYDYFYIAVMEKIDFRVVTADQCLHTVVQDTAFAPLVQPLAR